MPTNDRFDQLASELRAIWSKAEGPLAEASIKDAQVDRLANELKTLGVTLERSFETHVEKIIGWPGQDGLSSHMHQALTKAIFELVKP